MMTCKPFSVLWIVCLLAALNGVHAQSQADSLKQLPQKGRDRRDSTVVVGEDGDLYIYKKPRPFAFVTQVPRTIAWSARASVKKKSIVPLALIAVSTVALISVDQSVTDKVQQFGNYLGIDPERSYGSSLAIQLGGFKATVYDVPKNFNTAVYSIGEGLTSVVLAGGLYAVGKIRNDYRAVQTASQILQVQITVGVIGQTIKRISGRESPFMASARGGVWRPFPGFSAYQNNTARYDAFPSGHLATMMATVTILAMNYPEKPWIRWVGGSVITLVCFSMINNDVHWAGDYPLALGIGYVTARATVSMNRWVQHKK